MHLIRLGRQKTKTEMTIPVLNENLITICYNITKANEQVLNRYIKDIITERESVDQANQRQKEALRKEKKSRLSDCHFVLTNKPTLTKYQILNGFKNYIPHPLFCKDCKTAIQ